MGKGASAPQPTDPRKTGAAQTATNIGTSIAEKAGNLVNQVDIYGNKLNYDQTGTYQYKDPLSDNGAVYDIPTYTASQTLTPERQALLDTNNQTESNLSNLAQEQSGRLSGLLDKPIDLENSATEGRLLELGRKRLDPILDRRQEALNTRLTQQGIREGSTAFDRAQNRNAEGENDAYNQLLLSGRNQSVNEAVLKRQTPINEIIALASGSQLQNPNFVNAPQTGVAGTDFAGITQAADQQKLAAWQQQQAQRQSSLGGLFGLGASAITAFSDRRLKTDVIKVGVADNGLNIYSYHMIDGGPRQLGFMADEVAEVNPNAVSTDDSGYLMVDYGRAAA